MSVHDLAASGPKIPHLPIGDWVASAVDWLNNNAGPLLDGIVSVVSTCVNGLTDVLLAVPWPVMIVIFAALGWWLRTWKFAIFAVLGPLLIVSLELWDAAMKTLGLIIVAGVIALILAIPIGVAAAQSRTVSRIMKPILDFMQTMPAFVYLIPAVMLFSLGTVPGVVATVVFAMPPGVRLTELGIRQVDPEVVEAGEAFGAAPFKVLARIKLPLALGTIMAGVNQVIMLALSMVVIAGMVGAEGLGSTVTGALAQIAVGNGAEAGIAIVILAIYLDRVTEALGARMAPVATLERKMRRLNRRTARNRSAAEKAGDRTVGVDA
jgi:glycine betaine/proline transport system permease protein